MNPQIKVLIVGGRGFLGKYVYARLLQAGFTPITCDPTPGDHTHRVANILEPKSLELAVKDIDYVVNLVGLSPLWKPRLKDGYRKLHVEGVNNLAAACRQANIKRLIHVSAIGADINSKLPYAQTKGEAEQLLKNSNIPVSIIRPSLLFGVGAELMFLLDEVAKLKIIPLPHITAKVQPIYVGDVADIIVNQLGESSPTKVVEVAGTQQMTVFTMQKDYLNHQGALVIPLPEFLFPLGVKVISWPSFSPVSPFLSGMLGSDNVPDTNRAEVLLGTTGWRDWLSTS